MGIQVKCRCGKAFVAKPELAGKRLKCPSCEQPLAIPNPAPVEQSPLVVSCRCGQRFKAPLHLAGKSVGCPTCGQPIHVPADAPPDVGLQPLEPATDPFWDDVSQVESNLFPANTGIQGPPNPYSPPKKPLGLGAKKQAESTTEKMQRLLMLGFGVTVVLFGIGSLIKGIATWDQGFAADKALGCGMAGIIVGGIILAFLAMGGKIRRSI